MGKKAQSEQDEERLEKKVAARRKAVESPGGQEALRALRKRLKRVQRRRRTLETRLRHAAGKAGGVAGKPEPAAGA